MSEKISSLKKLKNWYERFERRISSLSLIGGFIFDAITLKRVDMFWDNFWVFFHLLIVAICIILINREEDASEGKLFDNSSPEKMHFWLVNILQFFFGGLLSTFIVFYIRSAVITVVWPFFLLLAIAFIANESFKKHYTRIGFQISFLFLCIYLYTIFYIPVLLHQISSIIFLISGGISLIALILFLRILKFFTKEGFKKAKNVLYSVIIGIYVLVNSMYFLGLIPPLPLSLQDAGIYHSIVKNDSGNYDITYEPGNFWNKFLTYVNIYPTCHITTTSAVYAYSAIFSPISFNTTITHEWQFYDETQKNWKTVDTINLSVIGGRGNGYRTYSIHRGLKTGKWRVNVKTSTGQIIGRMIFNIVVQDTQPQLLSETKN